MHFRACAAGDHLRHAYAAPGPRRYRNARCDGEKSGGDSEPASGLSYVGKIAPFRPNDLLTAELNASSSPQGLPFPSPLSLSTLCNSFSETPTYDDEDDDNEDAVDVVPTAPPRRSRRSRRSLQSLPAVNATRNIPAESAYSEKFMLREIK